MALAITRLELSAEDLRGEARRAKDSDQARRLLALALVLEGSPRTAAARAAGMDQGYDAIVEACCAAWSDLVASPATLASITRRNWASMS